MLDDTTPSKSKLAKEQRKSLAVPILCGWLTGNLHEISPHPSTFTGNSTKAALLDTLCEQGY